MRKLIRSGIAATALVATPFAAQAADIAPIYKARSVVPYYSWTGLYAGVNAGYSVARDPSTFTSFVNPVIGLDNNESYKISPAGFLAGAQLGYNWQSGNWVIGLEADFQGTGQRDSVCVLLCLVDGTVSGTVTQKLPWFGTVRGRLGFAADRALLYVTGGLAYGKVETSVTEVDGAAFRTTVSTSGTKTGWVVGAGIEAAVAGNWTAKVEYLYLDLGSQTLFFTDAAGPPGTITVTAGMKDHIIRGGVNYRFGAPASVAAVMPVKAPYAAAPSYSWAGLYFGVNAGYGVGRDSTTYFNDTVGDNTSFKISPAGILGGGQVGYNWQVGRWVGGLEADIQATAMKDTACTFGCIGNTFFNLFGIVEQKLPWFGTGRVRVGYAADGALFYLTGGVAYGKVETNILHIQGVNTVVANASSTKSGGVFGAGAEAPIGGNWRAKVEYLHIDLGSQSIPFAFTAGGIVTVNSRVTTNFREDIFRVGANYALDWRGPVFAKY